MTHLKTFTLCLKDKMDLKRE